KEITEGRFRSDLYYRLQVITINLPPLRKRAVDIPHLANYFLKLYRGKDKTTPLGFTPAALRQMQTYAWPGNVRELEHLVERYVVLHQAEWIDQIDLPEKLLQ